MKQWRICIVGAILVVALLSTTALASGHGHGRHAAGHLRESCAWSVTCLRDADGDGICDVCGRTAHRRVDADGDGIWDTWSGCCTDGDGDLICDTCGQAELPPVK